jgi:hypothetical protein
MVAFAVVAPQEVVHAGFMIDPIDGTKVSFVVSNDDHLTDGRVDSIDH